MSMKLSIGYSGIRQRSHFGCPLGLFDLHVHVHELVIIFRGKIKQILLGNVRGVNKFFKIKKVMRRMTRKNKEKKEGFKMNITCFFKYSFFHLVKNEGFKNIKGCKLFSFD